MISISVSDSEDSVSGAEGCAIDNILSKVSFLTVAYNVGKESAV